MKSKRISKKDILVMVGAISFAIFGAVICATLSDPAIAIDEDPQAPEVVEPTQPVTPEPAPAPTPAPTPDPAPEPDPDPEADPKVISPIEVLIPAETEENVEQNATQETTDNPEPTFYISFNYEIAGSTVVPELSLSKNGVEQDYKYGDHLEFTDMIKASNYGNHGGYYFYWWETPNGDVYFFYCYTPLGYEIESYTPSNPDVIMSDTEFLIKFKPSSLKYNISINITNASSVQNAPVAGYSLKLYDLNNNLIAEAVTDSSGKYTFADLDIDKAEVLLIGEGEGLTDVGRYILGRDYDQWHTFTADYSVCDKSQADLVLKSSDPAHEYFEWWSKSNRPIPIAPIFPEGIILKKDNLFHKFYGEEAFGGDAKILPDGSLSVTTTFESYLVIEDTFIPFCKEGYVVDHWNITNADGTVSQYKIGDEFNIGDYTTRKLIAEVVYVDPTPPGPEPTPTPDPGSNTGKLTSSPATGDSTNTGLVSLAILAAIAGSIYIVYRKRILN